LKIQDRHFDRLGGRLIGTYSLSGLSVRSCTFVNCRFGYNKSLFGGGCDRVANSEFYDCKVSRCIVGPAELTSVAFFNISGDMLISWGALFNQVVLEGRFSPMMFHGVPGSKLSNLERQEHIYQRDKYYECVDWALDISRADFADFEIRTGAIPLKLIRRDCNTQFIIKDERGVVDNNFIENLRVSAYTKSFLSVMIADGGSEGLLVAPRLDRPVFEEIMLDAEVLSKSGLLF